MTREAKVGLLLGLVFIVAIAVVLRGVNQVGQDGVDETEQLLRDAGGKKSVEMIDLASEARKLSSEEPVVNAMNTGTSSVPPDYNTYDVKREEIIPVVNQEPGISSYRPESRQGSWDSEVRHEMEPPRLDNQPLKQKVVNPPSAKFKEELDRTEIPKIVQKQGESPDSLVDRLKKRIGHDSGSNDLIKNQKADSPTKTYVAVKGDDLSKIAIKIYGRVEGKRWVNIKRIYQANKGEMVSMDDLKIGQKLKIPSIPGMVAPKEQQRLSPGGNVHKTSGAVYVVKKGDRLWSIAEKKLGSGIRYKEIKLLNKDTFKKGDRLVPGMKLKLPVK